MNSACPQCGVVYSVTPKDVGRRIACKRCRTALIVEETGLRVDPEFAGQRTDAGFTAEATVGEEAPPHRAAGSALSLPPVLTKLGRLDAATWLFGAGAVLAIVFLFFPLIDRAKVSRRNAAVQIGGTGRIQEGSPPQRQGREGQRKGKGDSSEGTRPVEERSSGAARRGPRDGVRGRSRGLLQSLRGDVRLSPSDRGGPGVRRPARAGAENEPWGPSSSRPK